MFENTHVVCNLVGKKCEIGLSNKNVVYYPKNDYDDFHEDVTSTFMELYSQAERDNLWCYSPELSIACPISSPVNFYSDYY
jgi:hypothetical protein